MNDKRKRKKKKLTLQRKRVGKPMIAQLTNSTILIQWDNQNSDANYFSKYRFGTFVHET